MPPYFDVISVYLRLLHPAPSRMNRRLGQRSPSGAGVPQDFARIWTALGRHRIPIQDLDDLAHAIVIAVLEGMQKRGAEIADPDRWFNGVILNQVRGWRRQRFLERVPSDEEAAEEEVIDEARSVEELLMSDERRRLIHQLYDEIPVDHLDVIIAHTFHDLSFEQIAAHFEKPVSTVYGYYRAGMRGLRAALARWKARHRNHGVLLLPLTVEALLDADRTAPLDQSSQEEIERAWQRHQQASRAAGLEDGAPASTLRPIPISRFNGLTAALPVIGSMLMGQPGIASVRSAAMPPDSTSAPVARVEIPGPTAPLASVSSAPGFGAPSAIHPASASAAFAAPRPQAAPAPRSTGHTDSAAWVAGQRMLGKARSAYILGNMQAAIMALEEYAQQCPGGQYARERDRMWIEALVALGLTSEACQRAESFRHAYPRSPLPAKLDPLCPGRRE